MRPRISPFVHVSLTTTVVTLLLILSSCLTQAACVVHPLPYRWCGGDVTYSFEGSGWSNLFSGGSIMKLSVYSAVDVINLETNHGNTIPIRLVESASGTGQIKLYFGSSPSGMIGETTPLATVNNFYTSVRVDFHAPSLGLSTSYSRETIALHELLHAVGVNHEGSAECASSVMFMGIQPNEVRFEIDAPTHYALECQYGNLLVGQCGSLKAGFVSWVRGLTGGADIKKGQCSGCVELCAPKQEASAAAEEGALHYELAVSSQGGPFVTVATLTEADWIDGSYFYAASEERPEAVLRMRVFDESGTQIDEIQAYEILDLETATAVEGFESETLPFQVFPNPGQRSTVSFRLARGDDVDLAVYDVAGRRVAVLSRGWMDPGPHRVEWSGRDSDGRLAAAGVYFLRLRVGRETHVRTCVRLK